MFLDESIGQRSTICCNIFALIGLKKRGDDVAGIEGIIPPRGIFTLGRHDFLLRDVVILPLLGAIDKRTVIPLFFGLLHLLGLLYRFLQDAWFLFCLLLEQVVKSSDMIMSIIRHIIFDLGHFDTIS